MTKSDPNLILTSDDIDLNICRMYTALFVLKLLRSRDLMLSHLSNIFDICLAELVSKLLRSSEVRLEQP